MFERHGRSDPNGWNREWCANRNRGVSVGGQCRFASSEMDTWKIAERVVQAEVSGRKLGGWPRCGIMDVTKVSVGRGISVEDAKERARYWRELKTNVNWWSCCGPIVAFPPLARWRFSIILFSLIPPSIISLRNGVWMIDLGNPNSSC